MKFENYLEFKPLFYSEISSTYMLYQVLNDYNEVSLNLLVSIIGKDIGGPVKVHREYRLSDAGNIDLLLEAKIGSRDSIVLIEGKVHDYLSATAHQITRYYEASEELFPDKDIYFFYLTQFNKQSISNIPGLGQPPTVTEFEKTVSTVKHFERYFHITWDEVHTILEKYTPHYTNELSHIISLQRKWMKAKTEEDLKEKSVEPGTRNIQSFLSDITISLPDELNFGVRKSVGKREVLEVDLNTCSQKDLIKIYKVFNVLLESRELLPFTDSSTSDTTSIARDELLQQLIESTDLKLASIYAGLFSMAEESSVLKLNGSGIKAFSILGRSKVEFSICTLYTQKHTLEFGLLR